MNESGFDQMLDASGLLCPEPVMLLHNKVREMAAGEVLKVIATDPSTQRDIPKFCTFLGHELLSQGLSDNQSYEYLIRKGAG
ncbi:sulfurtransferase TusA [Marinobacterium weihaiense]|uniref:Sulfurtransferase TusA n=1 Tax=Marinobacterium weihaiense TaxID=2851016 RepID=A0ABS6M716_9GAMM|nr:sulfurtransferase TusA [Marinobacterium weihaiense]MBV0931965.1 sulfurtransferase TusA [Marinobacterium weihaiense]